MFLYFKDLINDKIVKEKLDVFIINQGRQKKPNLIFEGQDNFNSTLIGNSTELLIELLICKKGKNKNKFNKKYNKILDEALNRLRKGKGNCEMTNWYINKPQGVPLGGIVYNVISSLPKNYPFRRIKLKKFILDYKKSILTICSPNSLEKKLDKSLYAILSLAHMLPLLNRGPVTLNPDYDSISSIDIDILKQIYYKIPNELFGNSVNNTIHTNYPVGFNIIRGRIDLILDKELYEIKSTKSFLSKPHLRQVALYYLALNQDPKFKNKITYINIYYALFGVLVKLEISKIFNLSLEAETAHYLETIK